MWAHGPLFRCSINIQSLAVLTGVCGLVCMYFTQVMSGHFFIPEPFVTVTFVHYFYTMRCMVSREEILSDEN